MGLITLIPVPAVARTDHRSAQDRTRATTANQPTAEDGTRNPPRATVAGRVQSRAPEAKKETLNERKFAASRYLPAPGRTVKVPVV